ncbi:tRNA (adenosine(37)-N6)-threonylcarbamoyltransferase complex ATPase subunit type 1 TsaE [Candidatus Vallotia lariciata]|uniref:tRNA (adenosine(37)-N6)-threonylcarbamoyltransferase complex ATPase subunit type 1 TsaE n=1 Tax=Candidatus Vallotia laricis TaxID=2018052 RepID=UPI001D034D80|nr:tRNA (adenosine(37)-N6)-threonylcarbamoyltransferase complex ATPase subunit type 1 TsaE [Candidatus Vallotia lariciata]UDG82861.1 tRNA threonylcarbamoyladenosine biosynthesis protein TsaE [Candidatus Vallotia lariciata]
MRNIQVLPRPLIECVFALADENEANIFGLTFAIALMAAIYAVPAYGIQVHLTGGLGAGKTTLVRAMLRALGYTQHIRSPTYTLVESYTIRNVKDAPLSIYHFDLYRFSDPSEWEDAGFREYFDARAVCLVEWPERAGSMLGVPDLQIVFDIQGKGRKLTARAYSETGKACLVQC